MLSRRQLLLSVAPFVLLHGLIRSTVVRAGTGMRDKSSWSVFQQQMFALAEASASGTIDQNTVVKKGKKILKQLDVDSASFTQAEQESYESGNRFWLWQRMMKEDNINGGVLNIGSDQAVQLHDHPGATGMVRVISGEVETWQFDEVAGGQEGHTGVAELQRVSHRILRPGDMAVLTPERGNIHALRSISKECRMLDFFIPPYLGSERSWFVPRSEKWFNETVISCRKIPQHSYTEA